MNTDDFEEQLRRQPMRKIPADWRGPILGACACKEAVAEESRVPAWRLLLARFPVAWGTVAALWVAMISVNALLAGSDSTGAAGQVASPSLSWLAWNQRAAELRQLASDDSTLDAETPAPQPAVNSPRSDRRRDWQFGEVLREPTLTV